MRNPRDSKRDVRDVTERPETIEFGSNILSGCDPSTILSSVAVALKLDAKWEPPREYTVRKVSDTGVRVAVGFRSQTQSRYLRRIELNQHDEPGA